MAGEKKGKAYEAFVKLALEKLKAEGVFSDSIFWDEKPEKMTIIPDLTIGENKNEPRIFLLITHSGSAKESEKKSWRNMGELAEAKVCLPSVPQVFNIAFDSVIKENLKLAQAATFDGQLIVGDLDYGKELQNWIDVNLNRFPKDKNEKVVFLAEESKTDKQLQELVRRFTDDLRNLIKKQAPKELDELWDLERSRVHTVRVPTAKNTFVRRGFIKALLVGDIPNKYGKIQNATTWMEKLGLTQKIIGGYLVSDDDLLWVTRFGVSWDSLKTMSDKCSTSGFLQQIEKVKAIFLLPVLTKWIEFHYDELVQPAEMVKWLEKFHDNPCKEIVVPVGVNPPKNLWLFDVVGALSKAYSGKSQGFGYSTLGKHPKRGQSKIGSMDIGDWCSCFFNQYFSRKKSFMPPKEAIEYVATVLSEALQEIPRNQLARLSVQVEEKYIAKEYEAVLLTHRGYEPLFALILASGLRGKRTGIRSCFGERARLTGQATKTTVLQKSKTLINWQSAHASHTNDKKKELCGRAVALRYSWDQQKNKFIPRPGVEKLILVVDGTWRQDDLNALARAGWDEVYYPDEIDKLANAIV